jgi:uncharacterized SAM-binding protein YcdF (DUF218 family)
LPTSELGLRALEDAVPKTSLANLTGNDIGGIIIMGGVIEGGEIALDRGEVSIGSAAERVTKAFELIRKHPDLPFIFSGYSARIDPRGLSEAEAFKQLIAEQGLSEKMAHYENQSRNTYENVVYMKPMIEEFGSKSETGAPKPWLLITSASHMYRSVKIFEKQGIAVSPLPVDYQTANSIPWTTFNLGGGADNWNNLMHELVGVFAYWITGKL